MTLLGHRARRVVGECTFVAADGAGIIAPVVPASAGRWIITTMISDDDAELTLMEETPHTFPEQGVTEGESVVLGLW